MLLSKTSFGKNVAWEIRCQENVIWEICIKENVVRERPIWESSLRQKKPRNAVFSQPRGTAHQWLKQKIILTLAWSFSLTKMYSFSSRMKAWPRLMQPPPPRPVDLTDLHDKAERKKSSNLIEGALKTSFFSAEKPCYQSRRNLFYPGSQKTHYNRSQFSISTKQLIQFAQNCVQNTLLTTTPRLLPPFPPSHRVVV